MALTTAAATVAATTGIAAYLDARFHLSKDIEGLVKFRRATKIVEKAARENRNSLFEFFEQNVKRLPENEECIWSRELASEGSPSGGSRTWRQTHDMCARYASFLKEELGVQENELVGFYLTNGVPYIVSLLATWAIGTAPAQLNYNLGGAGLLHCIKVAGCKVLLVDEDAECRARIEEVRPQIEEMGIRIVVLDHDRRGAILQRQPLALTYDLRKNVKPNSTLMLIYTSGTTGFPKATPFTHARLQPSFGSYFDSIGMVRQPNPNSTRWYVPMPMYHGTAAHATMMCLCAGATVCIAKKFSVSRFWDDVRASRATAFVYVGETMRYLLAQPESPRDKDNGIETVFGNGLRPDVWEKFQERFGVDKVTEFFNSSEGVFSLINYSCRGPYLATSVGHHGAINRLIMHNTIVPVAIDHDTGSIQRHPTTGFATRLPYSTGGEILVALPDTAAFAGYHGNPEATAKRFARDVFKKGDLYWRTGDALRRDDDGRWYFMDRLGDTFRWKSENVSTAEVAAVVGTYPGVLEANVYGVLVPKHEGRAGCAAVFLDDKVRDSFDYKGLLQHCRKNLPRYAVPVFLRVQTEMKAMHNQKQNKVPLREEGVDLEKVRRGHAPEDVLMWARPGGETYEVFREEDLALLSGEKAKL